MAKHRRGEDLTIHGLEWPSDRRVVDTALASYGYVTNDEGGVKLSLQIAQSVIILESAERFRLARFLVKYSSTTDGGNAKVSIETILNREQI